MKTIDLPDYLKGMTDDTSKSLISLTTSKPRISIRGRQFRFIEEGDEVSKTTDPINVIILSVVPKNAMARTYYINGYQPGLSDPPDCSSWDGIKPDTWCEKPQSNRCTGCKQSVWGSATSMSGKKAKACKDSKRLMLISAESVKDNIDNPTIYIFNVTIASLRALSDYGKFLVSNNIPIAAAITQIAFVDAEFPQVEFNFGGILTEKSGKEMLALSNKVELDNNAEYGTSIESKPVIGIPETTDTKENTKPDKQIDDLLDSWTK